MGVTDNTHYTSFVIFHPLCEVARAFGSCGQQKEAPHNKEHLQNQLHEYDQTDQTNQKKGNNPHLSQANTLRAIAVRR